jgi:hypothetical protein
MGKMKELGLEQQQAGNHLFLSYFQDRGVNLESSQEKGSTPGYVKRSGVKYDKNSASR